MSLTFITVLEPHFSASSSALISSTSFPPDIIPYLVAIFSSSPRIWLDIKIVFPCSFNLKSISLISTIPVGSSPLIGSSSIRKSGFPTSARPIPSLCFIPSEKSPAFFLPVSESPTVSNISGIVFLSAPSIVQYTSRFSLAVIFLKSAGLSIKLPTRFLAVFKLSPSNNLKLPSVIPVSPSTILIKVVFPAPFFPTKP